MGGWTGEGKDTIVWDNRIKAKFFEGNGDDLNFTLTDGSVLFAENNKLAQENSKLFWDNVNKRLGIGTVTPSGKTEIQHSGSATENPNLRLSVGNTTNEPRLSFNADRAANSDGIGKIKFFNNGATPAVSVSAIRGTTDLKGSWKWFTSNVERVRIDEDGNVGIGTVTPDEKVTIKDGMIHLHDSGVDHNFRYWESDVYGEITRIDPNYGGLSVKGISDHASGPAINFVGYLGSESPNKAAFYLEGNKLSGTAAAALGADDILFQVYNRTTPTITILGGGNVGIGVTDPHSTLEVAGAISSATSTFSTTGPTDNVDVAGINHLFVDTSSNDVTIGGFANGVAGQLLNVVKTSTSNALKLENAEGGGSQDIFTYLATDTTLEVGKRGGFNLICDGSDWYATNHAT